MVPIRLQIACGRRRGSVRMIQLTSALAASVAPDGIEMPVDRVADEIPVSADRTAATTPRRVPGPCRRRGTLARARRPSPENRSNFPRDIRAAFPAPIDRHPALARAIVVNDGGSVSQSAASA
jgi:hypothetical protein